MVAALGCFPGAIELDEADLASIADDKPGVVIEDKGYSIAVHYRLAPQLGHEVRDEVSAVCARFPSARLEILPGKSVVEVKQPSFNKGTAVRELMGYPPFAGRRPVFIGDDVTDLSVFAILPEFAGIGISVGTKVPGVDYCFEAPTDVRLRLSLPRLTIFLLHVTPRVTLRVTPAAHNCSMREDNR